MKFKKIVFVLLSALVPLVASAGTLAPLSTQDMSFETSDGLSIHGIWYKRASQTLVIISPGFAETSERPIFQKMSEQIAQSMDVVDYDVRGTGKSEGFYSFGAHDYLDIQAILEWAHGKYRKIGLLGFSIGAYSSMRAALEYPELVNKIFLVSCPQSLEDVMMSGGLFKSMLAVMTNQDVQQQQHPGDILFRWGYPFESEPNLVDEAPSLKVPAAFLVGGVDPLVFSARTRMIYDQVASPKTWMQINNGYHAEMMFYDFPTQFMGWLKGELKALE